MNLKENKKNIDILKSGDKFAFNEVYSCYYQQLCAFCSNYVSHEEAEDIVQDLMYYLWEKRNTWNENLSLKSFLFTAAKNRAFNIITHNQTTVRIYEDYQTKMKKEISSLDETPQTELFAIYTKTLKELSEEQLQAYLMSRYKHMTHKEIADALNVSVQTVNYRIGKALDLFRIKMKKFLEE